MARMVLLDDVIKGVRDARGVEPTDKNPLQRISGAVPLDGGARAYDFGIEVSEPAVDTISVFSVSSRGNHDGIMLTQGASSVVLVVDADDLCELHFDTIAAKQDFSYTYDPNLAHDVTIEDMRRLAEFVDSIPAHAIDPRGISEVTVPYGGDDVRMVVNNVFKGAGMVPGGDRGDSGLAGVDAWGLHDASGLSTVVKFDAIGSSRLLDRLGKEETVAGARSLLAEFASGYPRYTDDDFSVVETSRDMDHTFAKIQEALKTQDYGTCQVAFDEFLERESKRGHVSVEHGGYEADIYDDTLTDHPEPVSDVVYRFMRDDVESQVRVADEVHDPSNLPDWGSAVDDYREASAEADVTFVSDVIAPVIIPSMNKSVSEIELFDVLSGGDGASVDEPEM